MVTRSHSIFITLSEFCLQYIELGKLPQTLNLQFDTFVVINVMFAMFMWGKL